MTSLEATQPTAASSVADKRCSSPRIERIVLTPQVGLDVQPYCNTNPH